MPVEPLEDGRTRLVPPLSEEEVRSLAAGDTVVIRGTVVGARDAAHRRMEDLLDRDHDLPFDPRGAVLYYVGPTPERPGNVIGAAGPTTASRMDRATPRLLELGVRAVMGKGGRGPEVREALRRHGAVALAALGGGGALAARHVRAQRIVAFEDLGPEAIRELELEDFPAWVVHDASGRDFYEETVRPWRRDDLLPDGLAAPEDVDGALGGG